MPYLEPFSPFCLQNLLRMNRSFVYTALTVFIWRRGAAKGMAAARAELQPAAMPQTLPISPALGQLSLQVNSWGWSRAQSCEASGKQLPSRSSFGFDSHQLQLCQATLGSKAQPSHKRAQGQHLTWPLSAPIQNLGCTSLCQVLLHNLEVSTGSSEAMS